MLSFGAKHFLAGSDAAEVKVYENEVPSFAGPELDRLYGTLYASLAHFHACDGLAGVSKRRAEKRSAFRRNVSFPISLYRSHSRKVLVKREVSSH